MPQTRSGAAAPSSTRAPLPSLLIAALAALAACTMPSKPGFGAGYDNPRSAAPAAAPLTPERIAAILASPDRSAADRDNDQRRKPGPMLAFIGVRPGMAAIDLSSGGGYTSELLARAVGPTGRVYAQVPPRVVRTPPAQPEGKATPASAAPPPPAPAPVAAAASAPPGVGANLARRLGNPALAQLVAVVQPFENPVPAEAAQQGLDLATLMFNYHDLGHMGVDRDRMNRAVFAALKPGGVYVVADHAGRAGTGISESGTLHRVEEAFVKAEVERAGFRLAGSADFLRNPNDPRDRNTPEPPQPKDEFVLKFVKP
jgi:predicted methyltransferase